MIKYPDNDQDYLVIKKTPEKLTYRIGLKITRAYKSNNSEIQIQSFTTVDDLKNFALKREDRPFDIMIETDNTLQNNYINNLKKRKEQAKAKLIDRQQLIDRSKMTGTSFGGKRKRKSKRKSRKRKSHRRKTRRH